MTEKILEHLWVLFIGIFSWVCTRLVGKIDELEKNKAGTGTVEKQSNLIHDLDRRLDEVSHNSIGRIEYKSDVKNLHERCNELQVAKEDRIRKIQVVDGKTQKGK